MRLLILLLILPVRLWACEFSVGTINFWHYPHNAEERREQLRQQMQKDTPDIMAFTEAFKFANGFSLYNDFIEISKYQGKRLVANNWGFIQDGIAGASHLPTLQHKTYRLPETTVNSRQALLISTYQTCSGPVVVITAHLSPHDKNEFRRMAQMKFIAEKIREIHEPVILAGDLNAGYKSKIFDEIKKMGFDDVMPNAVSTFDPSSPYSDTKKPYRYDYIFFRKSELKLTEPAEIFFKDHPVSDHWGLRASFQKL